MKPNELMESPVINADLFGYAGSRIKNWKAPGPDDLHGFWIKKFTSLHSRLCAEMLINTLTLRVLKCCVPQHFNYVLSGESNFDSWLLQGKILKNPKRGAIPSNFRPITCLPTLWKLFSGLQTS